MKTLEDIDLSVVIPCYNAEATISEQLDALVNQHWKHGWEVVAADNGCTDHTMEIVRSYSRKLPLRIVDASARRGQPFALNMGAEAARGRSLAFCDADDVVGEGWLEAIGNALQKYYFVASRIEFRRLNPEWLCAIRGCHQQERGLQMIWYPPYLPHAGGGTIGVRKKLHRWVGGFDESLPYLHDTDFCFKLELAGFNCHFEPSALIHVRFNQDGEREFRQARRWAEYNVKVYKRYRNLLGMKAERPWSRYLRQWPGLIQKLVTAKDTKRRRLMWSLGWHIGLLEGSIKYFVEPVPR